MASESIAHSAFGLKGYIDSEPIRARGIIVKYHTFHRSRSKTRFVSFAFHFLSFFIIYKNAIQLTLARSDVQGGEGVVFLSFLLEDKTSASVWICIYVRGLRK